MNCCMMGAFCPLHGAHQVRCLPQGVMIVSYGSLMPCPLRCGLRQSMVDLWRLWLGNHFSLSALLAHHLLARHAGVSSANPRSSEGPRQSVHHITATLQHP